MRYVVILLLAGLTLIGCTTVSRQSPPGTEQGAQAPAPTAPEREDVVRVPAQTGSAVIALLARARQRVDAGDLPGAGAELERALRIEPENAVLWHYLARLRLNQSRWQQAEQLAERSNALAGDNRRLQRDNWRLIAYVRERAGDAPGADRARQRAEQLAADLPPDE